ncbi:MAG: MFS transporter [Deltaproteobacteria bacterium]|nr:MFS transporter [Deltaproteobacteria bacterium]
MRPPALLLGLAYLAFISLGLPDTVPGVAWPSIRATFGLSPAGLGAMLGTGMCGYFLSGLVAGRLVRTFGVGTLLVMSTGLVTVGLAGYALAPDWLLFLPFAALIGLGSGAIDTALNGYAARHLGVRHLNWLHACWGIGATLGPVIMTSVLVSGLSFRAGYALLGAALGAMALAFALTRRSWEDEAPLIPPSPAVAVAQSAAAARLSGPEKRSEGWVALHRGRVWLQISLFFVYTGLETTAGQWCFTVLRETHGLGVEAAGAWTSAYWGSLLAGRVVLGLLINRIGPDLLLRITTVTALVGALGFTMSSGLVGRLGIVLLGASLAPLYPTLMARTPERLGPSATTHAIGFQVSAATLGAGAVPAAVGLWVAPAGAGIVPPAVVILAVLLLVLHETLLRVTGPPPTTKTALRQVQRP